MLGYMAYSGMPSHYPHWSYGKSYEKLKTLYDHGVSGLPYEMVINSNPAIAYLMRDNSLLLHILTIAHVYGHNDFFKNNFTFRKSTRARSSRYPTFTKSRSSLTRTCCCLSAITTRSLLTSKKICSLSSIRKPSTSSP